VTIKKPPTGGWKKVSRLAAMQKKERD